MNKKGLTLVELIIAITISAILFGFLFIFISDSIDGLNESNTKTQIMDNIFNTKNKISRYVKSGYIGYNIIGTGGISNYVLYLKTEDEDKGVIFGTVDIDTMKLQNYNIYGRNYIGYRTLSKKEVENVDNDYSIVYNIKFHKDKIVQGAVIKSFQPEIYNSGALINIDIEYLNNFNESLIGNSLSGTLIKKEDIYKTNLVF